MVNELAHWRLARGARSRTTSLTDARERRARRAARSIASSIVVAVVIAVLSQAASPSRAAALFGEHIDVAGNDFSTATQFDP